MTKEYLLTLCNTYRSELYLAKESQADLHAKLECEELKETVLKTILSELQEKSLQKSKKISTLETSLKACMDKLDELGFVYDKTTSTMASKVALKIAE